MEYPSAEDYMKAVQDPRRAFVLPELVRTEFDVHPLLQIPVPASGTTAVVFKARVDGVPQALRFFTREDASTRERYTALNTYFAQHGLTANVATCRWLDDAITVNGRRWPMVQMDWVEGPTLDRRVEDLVDDGDRAALGALAGSWRTLIHRTQAAGFAHGDLQHGNVLVEGDTLRLVDFDSAWILPFSGQRPPSEHGHRNYQHPNRVWGPWMDTFPGLVVYLSLLALARDPRQWATLNDGENLLFRRQDFQPPYQTPAWWELAQLRDPQVDALSTRLRACCAPGWTATGNLESLLGAPEPWWMRTGTTPLPRPTPSPRPRRVQAPPPAPVPMQSGTWQYRQGAPPRPAPIPAPEPARRPWMRAVGVAMLVWLVGFIALSGVLAAAGLRGAGMPVIAAVGALVPAAVGFGMTLRNHQPTLQPGRKGPP